MYQKPPSVLKSLKLLLFSLFGEKTINRGELKKKKRRVKGHCSGQCTKNLPEDSGVRQNRVRHFLFFEIPLLTDRFFGPAGLGCT